MTKVQKRLIEREFEQVLSQVETELVSATAPKITSKVSYSRLKQEVVNNDDILCVLSLLLAFSFPL